MSMTRLPWQFGLSLWQLLLVLFLSSVLSAAFCWFLTEVLGLRFLIRYLFAGEFLHYQGGSPVLSIYFGFRTSWSLYSVTACISYFWGYSNNARKPIFGYRAMIMSIIAIGFINYSLGTSYVRFRDESVPWFGIYFYYFVDCSPSAKAFNYILLSGRGIYNWIQQCCFPLG
jgi:cytochrome c oxidase subunit 1